MRGPLEEGVMNAAQGGRKPFTKQGHSDRAWEGEDRAIRAQVWAKARRRGLLRPLSPSPSHPVPGCPLLRSLRFSEFDARS